jgi:hypothetical protein
LNSARKLFLENFCEVAFLLWVYNDPNC